MALHNRLMAFINTNYGLPLFKHRQVSERKFSKGTIMGVTIHYRGRLADIGKIEILCEDLNTVISWIKDKEACKLWAGPLSYTGKKLTKKINKGPDQPP